MVVTPPLPFNRGHYYVVCDSNLLFVNVLALGFLQIGLLLHWTLGLGTGIGLGLVFLGVVGVIPHDLRRRGSRTKFAEGTSLASLTQRGPGSASRPGSYPIAVVPPAATDEGPAGKAPHQTVPRAFRVARPARP